ncbi:hypothetical protein HUB97_11420 [Halorubraceae archaeon YAN]|nr:hypothetical protein [Halorubraceae archaeon YAN]
MAVEMVFRLLAAAVLIVAPTLLFLGFWHGMQYLRNEQLIEQLYGDTSEPVRPPQFDFSVLFSTNGTHDTEASACVYCGKTCRRQMCRSCRDQYL